ncbi:MAG: hypothetical protein ABJN26_28410 [Stappiaceae bacterium]
MSFRPMMAGHTMAAILLAFTVAAPLVIASPAHSNDEEDELAQMGLPEDIGREEVEIYCSACHSLKLVAQQGLSSEDWDETITWMVEEQAMDPLEKEDHKLVLDYLAKHLSVEARLGKVKR